MVRVYECWPCATRFDSVEEWLKCEMAHVQAALSSAALAKSLSMQRFHFCEADLGLDRVLRQLGEYSGRPVK